jgi:MoaA/NifB/PqqE/SkfB family radical SAM enzyme
MIRKSYLSYARKAARSGGLGRLARNGLKLATVPAGYLLGRPVTGPLHGFIVVTYDCNLRCQMCDLPQRHAAHEAAGQHELTTEELFEIIDDFAAIGTSGVGLTGGEPFLRRDLYELIARIKQRGMLAQLNTNGWFLSDERCRKLLQSGVDAVSVSVDGASAETHDRLRGLAGSFERAMEGVSRLLEVRKATKSDTTVVVVFVISRQNFREVPDFVERALGMGVDHVSFMPFADLGELREDAALSPELRPLDEDLAGLDETVDYLQRRRAETGRIDSSERYLELFRHAFRGRELPIPCLAGYVTLGVDGLGNLYPCFPHMEMKRPIANLREQRLRDLFGSDDLARKLHEVRDCRACFWNCQTELNLMFSPRQSFPVEIA